MTIVPWLAVCAGVSLISTAVLIVKFPAANRDPKVFEKPNGGKAAATLARSHHADSRPIQRDVLDEHLAGD